MDDYGKTAACSIVTGHLVYMDNIFLSEWLNVGARKEIVKLWKRKNRKLVTIVQDSYNDNSYLSDITLDLSL